MAHTVSGNSCFTSAPGSGLREGELKNGPQSRSHRKRTGLRSVKPPNTHGRTFSIGCSSIMPPSQNSSDVSMIVGWKKGMVPGTPYNVYFLLHGVIQHDLYHAGQIALLKKG